MSATVDQFREVLDAEDNVHMGKLADMSRHGVPNKVRGEVWKYLLTVSKPDKSEQLIHERKLTQEYNVIGKTVSSDVKKNIKHQMARYYSKDTFFQEESVQNKIQNVLCAYLNYNTAFEYSQGTMAMLAPFVYTLKKEPEIFWSCEALMKKLEHHFAEDSITDKLSRFIMYLRSLYPALFNYFEEQELSPNDWAPSWLQYLLARELPLECTLRLWDTYFAGPEGLDLHIYVCIAILANCSEELMELEISELKSFLQHLPVMDMDKIISQAYNYIDEIKSHNLI